MAPNKKHTSDAPKRRNANTVISLTQFAHSKSKGTRRAIENFKYKKQSKFNRNAGLLRGYKKAMKTEGFEVGKGASRKRTSKGMDQSTKRDDGDNDGYSQRMKKRQKSDPFAKAKQKAKQSKEEIIERQNDIEKQKKLMKRKATEKKVKTRKLSKRTKKGQPIMKDMISDMLEKIKSDG
mmetsp:Transcript_4403/g.6721  ORF Transcript_4403/g.6721 Transcript_4403/m.6721 type:complete len:179 (-) Transcript_4403:253-789(-)|eukprot:CAMPEP_0197250834 /NCGR_PEP_ID=MMETSP1429-20130617/54518_1 /TAXON_ID=49237 /ORGANISM="Chaetoceros  sp., Strain UNC1202" /LENGTH=178 /DNA_ID=CAMNT_0042712761 /DNA_START=159 /DNA_END=695 /DNA_ORIENTATION=-